MLKKRTLLPFIVLYGISCWKSDSPVRNTDGNNYVSVLTQHNNNTRSGLNDKEVTLTIANVNQQQFGKLFTLNVDDQVYAQPLIVANLVLSGTKHNVVFIATVNNTVYAYDGDSGALYWQRNYTLAGMRPPKNTDMTGACSGNYNDFSGNIGIVGTPVIDSLTHTMYFVTRSTDGINYIQHLHAINIMNGSEMPGSPVKINAIYNANGTTNDVIFDSQKQNQRMGLTLLNGIVYISYASHCDWGPYHGWVLGYNAGTLQQQVIYSTTPEGSYGGIWESGTGMAADNQGNLYCVVGNGTVGANNDPTILTNRGESALKLTPSGSTLKVSSYFTPWNYTKLDSFDLDYGSLGAFLIPNSNYYFTGAKDGNIYLLNKDKMGGFSTSANSVQQNIKLLTAGLHCQPSYYKGAKNEWVYVWSDKDHLRAYPFNRVSNLLDVSNVVTSPVPGPLGWNGALLSVSSNGTAEGTGIVWASYASGGNANQSVCPGILRALDANDVTKELWNSSLNTNDYPGNYAKFSSPTIANGHVYLATFSNQVVVYGLK